MPSKKNLVPSVPRNWFRGMKGRVPRVLRFFAGRGAVLELQTSHILEPISLGCLHSPQCGGQSHDRSSIYPLGISSTAKNRFWSTHKSSAVKSRRGSKMRRSSSRELAFDRGRRSSMLNVLRTSLARAGSRDPFIQRPYQAGAVLGNRVWSEVLISGLTARHSSNLCGRSFNSCSRASQPKQPDQFCPGGRILSVFAGQLPQQSLTFASPP